MRKEHRIRQRHHWNLCGNFDHVEPFEAAFGIESSRPDGTFRRRLFLRMLERQEIQQLGGRPYLLGRTG